MLEPELSLVQPEPELGHNQPDPELDYIPLHELHANLYETELFADQYAADLFGYLLDDGEEEEGVILIRPIEFTKQDLESDRRMWAVYARYVLFKHLRRTIKEMRRRFYCFYYNAIRTFQRRKGEMSDFYSLGGRCDFTDSENGLSSDTEEHTSLRQEGVNSFVAGKRVTLIELQQCIRIRTMKLRELQEGSSS